MSDATEARVFQSADIEVMGESTEKIISETRYRSSTLFKKFTIREIRYRWIGTNAEGESMWVGQAHVREDF